MAEAAAVRLESQQLALWRGALTHAPDLEEAHVALAEVAFALHAEAEVGRDGRALADAEAHLREHAGALPAAHPVALRIAAYLRGDGALTLDTSPSGAEVVLFRHEVRNRRLVEVPVRRLGPTPLREVPLPMGSYVCVLEHPARAPVRYPVAIGRGERWDGGGPVWLPPPGTLGPDDCLVPGGWFWSGGDPEAGASLPRRRLWCDTLVVKRFPVTNREYMAFLDDLVARGREDEALRHAPRERVAELERSQVYGRDATGRFVLRADADGDTWDLDWPVLLVDWFGASAYAAWLADRTGRPWRLPTGLEWEKTARGVDGRFHPWGDGFDPTWCCMRSSQPDRLLPAVVDSFPVDVSVYGVRGLAGNVQEWCADVFAHEGPALPDGRVVVDLAPGDTTSARGRAGGGWSAFARSARCAVRGASPPAGRSTDLGFRCVYRPS